MKTITIIHCFLFIYTSCFSQVERYASLDKYAPLNAYLSTDYDVKLEKAIIKSPTTRLFVIDSIWGGGYLHYYAYPSPIEVEPGIHTFEFKYPNALGRGRIFSATFNLEGNKTYSFAICDTNSYYPMVKELSGKILVDDAIVKDVLLKQISLPKSDSKTIRLPDVEDNKYATLVSSCCSGFYDSKGKFKDIGNVIKILKIDYWWGPNSDLELVLYNGLWDGGFNIELAPGIHNIYYTVYPAAGMHQTNLSGINNKFNLNSANYSINKVYCLTVNVEPDKYYGFDYMISFRTEKVSDDFYFDVKIIETLNK